MPIALQSDPTVAIATALHGQLQALDWPAELTDVLVFQLVAVPEMEREEIDPAKVYVLVGSESTEVSRASRASTSGLPKIGFAVRATCTAADRERFEWLQSLAYTISRQILLMTKADLGGSPDIVRTTALYDQDRLRRGEFLTVRTITFLTQATI